MPWSSSACDAGPTMCGGTTQPFAVDEERLGIAGHAVAADERPAVAHDRVVDVEALEERERGAAQVLHVDADEDDALRLPVLGATVASVRASSVHGAQ